MRLDVLLRRPHQTQAKPGLKVLWLAPLGGSPPSRQATAADRARDPQMPSPLPTLAIADGCGPAAEHYRGARCVAGMSCHSPSWESRYCSGP
jgi:hypothetical protein